jgi:hypothetical protein
MKKILAFIILTLAISSCRNTWDSDDKKLFYQACMEDANSWAGDKAKPYCDCMTEKMMKKYPNENDALEHIDSVINDPDLKSCKAEIMNQ